MGSHCVPASGTGLLSGPFFQEFLFLSQGYRVSLFFPSPSSNGFSAVPQRGGVCCISFGSFRLFSLVLGVEGSRLDSMSFTPWLLSFHVRTVRGAFPPSYSDPVFSGCVWWGLWRTAQWVCLPFVFHFLTSTHSAVSCSLTIPAELFLVESSVGFTDTQVFKSHLCFKAPGFP